MGRPTSRDELLARMDSELDALLADVELLAPDELTRPGACGDWSAKDLLAHLDAWLELFLGWERIGSAGGQPAMPAPGFTWAELPALNAELRSRSLGDAPDAVMSRLRSSHQQAWDVIAGYTDDDLFAKRRYGWTGTTSVGSYAVSATTSHYAWARKEVRRYTKGLRTAEAG